MQAPYVHHDDPPRRWRVPLEEYFAAESTALVRHEYFDGVVRAMPGASGGHVVLTSVLAGMVEPEMRRRGACRFLNQDVQIWIPESNAYTYPDGAIACPPKFAAKGPASLSNPKVIFEALSPSTEAYDRGGKFRRYRSLPTLEEYVLLSVEEPLVEVFRRDGWALRSYEGLGATVRLESVDLDLPLRELYADLFGESA